MTTKASWWLTLSARSALASGVALAGATAISCSSSSTPGGAGGGGGASTGSEVTTGSASGGASSTSGGIGGGDPTLCVGVTCSGHGKCVVSGNAPACTCDNGYVATDPTTCALSDAPTIGGCQLFPSDNIFNTPIDAMPAHAKSAVYLKTIGDHKLHLDLGQSEDASQPDTYYGIPYNVVHGGALTWAPVHYYSADPELSWNPSAESDCVDASSGSKHTIVSPCLASAASQPVFPIPGTPLIEGSIDTDPSQPPGDHHLLLLDADTCLLSEFYHVYPHGGGGWDIFGSYIFNLGSNKLRPDGWTSADAAGFPILPLLLRADEASSGTIKHALRFTILSNRIREEYVWPARHQTPNSNASTDLPAMGQLFRLKASYMIPENYNVQARAILQALKTYGMYIADGGSNLYIQGEPSAAWADDTFSQVQSVATSQFEAVDLTPIHQRAGFDINSGAVPK